MATAPKSPRDGEETAVSGAGLSSTPAPNAPGELTDASGPTDATVVRATPSSPTINENNAKPGANSFGKYELLSEIARGGMGVVYRARQHGLDRLVALKMILGTGTDHETAARFLQEARAAAALDHPNVVPIYDIGEIDGRPYFTMALIDGPNLRGYTDSRGTLPIAEVMSLFAQVVEGVAHAHKHGIIHRDLKPANVLIDKDGRPRVTDFGLAKRVSVDSALTTTGQVVGTPQYMAPEQARDSKDVGPPADVYALGGILHFLLTGKPPFHAESFTDLVIKVVTAPAAPPSELRPDVPADIDELCLRCLAKAPADRFPDAGSLSLALAPVLNQYLAPSANRSTPVVRLRTPSEGTVPDLSSPSAPSVPSASGPVLSNTLSVSSLANSAPAKPQAVETADAPARNRTSVIIGLSAISLVLVALAAYLLTRDKKPEVVKNDPPPIEIAPPPHTPGANNPNTGTPGGSNPNTTDPKTNNPNPGTPNPPANDGDKFAWPAPSRADFGLKFELAAVGAAKDKDGVIPVVAGTPLILHVTPEKDCRVTVWLIEPNGHVMRVFPNEFDTDDLVKGRQTRVIGETKSKLEASPTVGDFDRLRVIATTGDAPIYPPGAKVNQHTVYATESDRERLVSTVRGVVIKKAGTPGAPSAVAEAELRFRAK